MHVLAFSLASPMAEANAEIARGLKRRDSSVLDGLVEKYQYRLLRYLVYLSGDRTLSEDLFQETWLRVLERGHQYDGKTRFEVWLFAIARHLVIDTFRAKRAVPFSALAHNDSGEVDFEATGQPSPLELVQRNESTQALATALQRLQPLHREVLLLRFQEELPLEEVAQVLDVPLSTAKSRLYRSLQALQPWLEGAR